MKKILIILAILLLIGGGWLVVTVNNDSAPSTAANDPDALSPNTENLKVFSAAEVAEHNTANDCWTIINNSVYDITSYIPNHPGGDEILRACGNDATSLFTERRTEDGERVGPGTPHSAAAEAQLDQLLIGRVE